MSLKFTARARFLIYIYIYVAYILTRCPIARRFRVVSARRQPRLISLHRNEQDIVSHSFQPTKRPAYRIASSSATSYKLVQFLIFLTRQLSTSIDTKKKNLKKSSSLSLSISILSRNLKLCVIAITFLRRKIRI